MQLLFELIKFLNFLISLYVLGVITRATIVIPNIRLCGVKYCGGIGNRYFARDNAS